MRRQILFALLFFVVACKASAQNCGNTGQLPCTLGWYSIPNSALASVVPTEATYPEIWGTTGSDAIIESWGANLYDSKRDCLINKDSGGHGDYFGNGVYAFCLGSLTSGWTVLLGTSHGTNVTNAGSCPESYLDGTPSSRHQYNGQWYLPTQDLYFDWGSGLPSCGSFTDQWWLFNPNTNTWTEPSQGSSHPNPASTGTIPEMGYDPVTDSLWYGDANAPGIWQYNPATNVWILHSTSVPSTCGTGTNDSSVIDVNARYLYIADNENGLCKISLNSPYTATVVGSPSSCGSIFTNEPGMAYDPVRRQVGIWTGGNTMYFYNQSTNSCSSVTYSGGPSASVNGVLEKLQYSLDYGGFVTYVSNTLTDNVYFLRVDQPTDADFVRRCSTTGVVVCEGFDNAAEFNAPTNPNTGAYANSGPVEIVQDTTNYVSGGASLHFPMTANGAPVQNNNWLQEFCGGVNILTWAVQSGACTQTVFAQNSDLYLQFRYMVDGGYLQNWETCCNSSPKIADVAYHTSTCGQTEMTINNRNGTGEPMAYGDCGGYGMYVNTSSGLFSQDTPYNFQSGYYNCEYPNTPLSPGGCFTMPANTWMTFYEHVHIGTYNSSNSVFQLWVGVGSGPLQYLINIPNFVVLPMDDSFPGYDSVWFNVYMTNFSGNNAAANVWLDEVIVSTQPIPAPGVIPTANPPPAVAPATNLFAKVQ
jgi:hypothetical protein